MKETTAKAEATRYLEENILKNIKMVTFEKGYVLVHDLAEKMDMNPNTMYAAVNRMVDKGYIYPLVPRGGRNVKRSISLTEEGDRIAGDILEKHQLIQQWLIRLGIPEDQADQEACSLEHGITDTIMKVLQRHVEMANRYMGSSEGPADEVMQTLAEESDRKAAERSTMTARVLRMIEQLGGLEGAERKDHLSQRAGGDKELERLLDQVEKSGGVDSAIRQLEVMELAAEAAGDGKRAVQRIPEIAPMLRIAGRESDFNTLAEIIHGFGGLKQLLHEWPGLMNLHSLESEVGGARFMKDLVLEARAIGGISVLRQLVDLAEPFESPARMLTVFNRSLKPLVQELKAKDRKEK